jgi:rubrerythrin
MTLVVGFRLSTRGSGNQQRDERAIVLTMSDSLAIKLQKAEQLESLAADLYLALARRFVDQPAVARGLESLAQEEVVHAGRIRILADACSKRGGGDADVVIDVEVLDKLIEQISASVQRAEESDDDTAVVEALGWASRMEDQLRAIHAELMAGEAFPELEELFEFLVEADGGHAERLHRIGLDP